MKKSIFLFLLILAAWGAFSLLPLSWQGWQPATCLSTTGCFCEAIHPGTVAQPANAWSSLAFVLPGLLILAHSSENKPASSSSSSSSFSSSSSPLSSLCLCASVVKSSLSSSPFLRASVVISSPLPNRTFALALIIIGLGSAFYHASLTFAGQFMDVLGMYLLLSFAALYGLARLSGFSARRLALAYLATNLLLAAILLWLPGIRREVFAGLVLLTLAVEAWRIAKNRAALQVRWLALAFASLGVAYVIWILDNNAWLCAPHSWLQGHAVWHILGALAAWFLYLYYQTETSSQ